MSRPCDLCGQETAASEIEERRDGRALRFCCHGCRQVFLILSAANGVPPEGFRETELYRACVEWGVIPASNGGGPDALPQYQPEPAPLDLTYRVSGMWCPSCAWLIREVLARSKGVTYADVSFATDTLRVKYLPHRTSPKAIEARAERLGYHLAASPGYDAAGRDAGSLLLRLGVSAILTANIMMVSFALYSDFFLKLHVADIRYFSYPLLVMASVVLFYGGLPILRRGAVSLFCGLPSMDTLVSIGALSSYVYSAVQVGMDTYYLYFDTSSMLVTFVLLGRYIEMRARQRSASGVAELYRVLSGKAKVTDAGREQWVRADSVRPGDRIVAAPGDSIPVDSRIVKGSGLFDVSFLTGESKARALSTGDEVPGGSVVAGGQDVLLEALRTSRESVIGRMVETVEEALGGRGKYELLADRTSRAFVPVVIAIAAGTGLFALWAGIAPQQVFLRSLAVLLIACPCALGIAVPLVKAAVMGAARKKGIIIRLPEALEKMKDIDTVVFDKTGTLTEGRYALEAIVCDDNIQRVELLARLASVEVHSNHFVAGEIVREARRTGAEIEPAGALEAFDGLGVKGCASGLDIYIGSRAFMERSSMALGERLAREAELRQSEGKTVAFFAWEGAVRGFLVLGDTLKPRAHELVDGLRARGIDVHLVSGDSMETTRSVACSLDISSFKGEALPADKVEMVRALQADGRKVAMVGDGINDAAALAAADVGCAVSAALGLSSEACDLSFTTSDPALFLDAYRLSVIAARSMRQNLLFAFFYNAIAVPAAAAGLLNPLLAVFAMFASSITVTGNALRVSLKPEALKD